MLFLLFDIFISFWRHLTARYKKHIKVYKMIGNMYIIFEHYDLCDGNFCDQENN